MPAWTIASLKAADAALGIPGLTDAAAALNAQTVSLAAQDVLWRDIRDILMNNFDWGTLVVCASLPVGGTLPGTGAQTTAIQSAASAIRESCLYGEMFASSVQANWNRLVSAASLLTPALVGGISSASSTAVVALRTPVVPVWQPPVTTGDIQTARSQP